MKVIVTKEAVVIAEYSCINEGEVCVNTCYFDLPECFEGLSVTAAFNNIPVPVSDNQCNIPSLKKGTVTLGVYAYTEDENGVTLMYSPKPTVFYVNPGSYLEEIGVEETPTVTEFEQYCRSFSAQALELVEGAEQTSNKVTEITEESTDEQYPTAKAVYDLFGNIEVSGGVGGFSPIAKVEQTDEGATITITDKNGTTLATIKNGNDGKNGQNGKDGLSATHSWNGTVLTVTSASGTSSEDLKGDKGDAGASGSNGKDGTSVTITNVTESTEDGGINVVTFSDGKTLNVKNGNKGADGKDYVLTDTDKDEIVGKVIEKLEGGSTETTIVSFLDTASKTESCYSRWSTSSNIVKTTASNAWNTYRGAVTEGEEWNIKAYSVGDAYAVLFLNSTGGLISTIPTTAPSSATWIDETITVPSGAVEMIVNEETNQINSRFGTSGVVVEKTITTGGGGGSATINSHLYGKVLLACGDSITDAYDLSANNGSYLESYAEIVANRNGMTFKKDAVSGSTIAYNASGDTPISTKAFSNTRYKNLPNFDYLTIWFGWNDGAFSTLGTINDADNTTFYGAYKKVLEHLVTNNPTKKIGIIVPKLKASRSLIAPTDMANAVKEISALYGVPCLDLSDYNRCSALWGEENAVQQARNNALTFDGTHPNQMGHEYLSSIYENFIKSL